MSLTVFAPVGGQGNTRPTLQAVRTTEPIEVDGVLDEGVWAVASPATGFRQRWPVDGAPASEKTEVRVAYDERTIYFGIVFFDSEPELIRRSIFEREGDIHQDDHIWIALDTFHDRRSAYLFEIGALGTQGDAHFTDEMLVHPDDWMWEGVYESETRVTDFGWVLEVAIPLTTIRFEAKENATMGVAFQRTIPRKTEQVLWPHIGQDFRSGIFQASQYATLTGFQDLEPGRHVEVKPYGILGAQKVDGEEETTVLDDVGLDIKYSITPGLTLDLTYNTDFAQVEADNVQINLTRFGLFFPEKREFFLERSELFQFGNSRTTEVFFSRRIGRTNDIIGGGRVTGQAGPLSVGFLNLQTDDSDSGPGANNTVLRLRGDVLPRATVGGIFTNLQNSEAYDRSAGLDAEFRFFSSSVFRTWWSGTYTDREVEGESDAWHANLTLQNNLYALSFGHTDVGEAYSPALGFVRRRNMKEYSWSATWRPRFEGSSWARQLRINPHGFWIDGQDGEAQSEDIRLDGILDFQTGDMAMVGLTHRWERLEDDWEIRPGVFIPQGDYPFNYMGLLFRLNDSREVHAQGVTHFGEFWNGNRFQYGGALTWKTGPHLRLTGSIDRNDVSLPVENGDFTTTIYGLDIGAALNRKLFANALIQYDSDSEELQANIRINWIHTPGSDLFVVLNTGYFAGDLLDPNEDRWVNRTGVVKLTYLKAF
jgi:hypothetical protein